MDVHSRGLLNEDRIIEMTATHYNWTTGSFVVELKHKYIEFRDSDGTIHITPSTEYMKINSSGEQSKIYVKPQHVFEKCYVKM